MLHTKFQGHWLVGSGEGRFVKVFNNLVMATILVMCAPYCGHGYIQLGCGGTSLGKLKK